MILSLKLGLLKSSQCNILLVCFDVLHSIIKSGFKMAALLVDIKSTCELYLIAIVNYCFFLSFFISDDNDLTNVITITIQNED